VSETETKIRRWKQSDLNFIIKSWIRPLSRSGTAEDFGAGYWQAQKSVILDTLANAKTYVAYRHDPEDPGDEDFIVGFVVGEESPGRTVYHWVYVRNGYRRRGVAKALMAMIGEETDRTSATATTAPWTRDWLRRKGYLIAFMAPYLAFIERNAPSSEKRA
jgi:GNAT superfamily N-acetyltransferase